MLCKPTIYRDHLRGTPSRPVTCRLPSFSQTIDIIDSRHPRSYSDAIDPGMFRYPRIDPIYLGLKLAIKRSKNGGGQVAPFSSQNLPHSMHIFCLVLRGNSGSLQSHKSDSFAISIPLGKKIAIKIKQLRLKPRGLVTVRSESGVSTRIQVLIRDVDFKLNPT